MTDWVFSVALVVLGISAYLVTGRQSLTALLPSAFGAVAGAAHGLSPGGAGPAVVLAVAVLGLLGTGRAIVSCVRDGIAKSRGAVRAKALMACCCVAYLLARAFGS